MANINYRFKLKVTKLNVTVRAGMWVTFLNWTSNYFILKVDFSCLQSFGNASHTYSDQFLLKVYLNARNMTEKGFRRLWVVMPSMANSSIGCSDCQAWKTSSSINFLKGAPKAVNQHFKITSTVELIATSIPKLSSFVYYLQSHNSDYQ